MGKMFQNTSSLKPLGQLKPNCPGMIIGRSSVCYANRKSKMAATTGHSINTGPYGENTEIYSSLKLLHWLNLNCINHWKVLYKLCVFYVDRNSKMTTTAGHSFYIGPIGSFYNQVNDTGFWEPLVFNKNVVKIYLYLKFIKRFSCRYSIVFVICLRLSRKI